jgi:flavin-dependent dehydrogenase
LKIAIIGAGISGLSCAYQLVKKGITPVIFEKNSYVGDQMEYSSLWSRWHSSTIIDSIKYLKKTFDLEITPMEKLRTIELILPDKKMIDNGELGYIFRRGKESHSLEKQLESKINAQIVFDSYIKIEDIKESFDKIIVATGNNLIAKQYNLWTYTYTSQVRVATILGNFDTGSIKVWSNRNYAKNTFCYLVPNNALEASLVMITKGIMHHELYYYWDTFISEEGIFYNIIEVRDAELSFGFVSSHEKEQLYFIGNAVGFIDRFIGAGDFNAILSGICAAKAVIENNSHNDSYKTLDNKIIYSTLLHFY